MKIHVATQTMIRLDECERAAQKLLDALKDQGGVMAKGAALERIEHARNILTQIQSLRFKVAR